MQPALWTDRKFNFDFPADRWPVISARLEGAFPRIEYLTRELPAALLTYSPNGKWSIQRHIGHLIDLEELHKQRIRDFQEMKPVLSAWDTSNKKTEQADHDQRSIASLLKDFFITRNELIDELSVLSPVEFAHISLHPRLQVPIRLVDMSFFIAEHDDHHIAHIIAIIKLVNM